MKSKSHEAAADVRMVVIFTVAEDYNAVTSCGGIGGAEKLKRLF